jgi:hypothetical protein
MVNESSFVAIARGVPATGMPATRLLAVLACANALCFSLCNGLGLLVSLVPWVYGLSLAMSAALFLQLRPRRIANPPPALAWVLGLGFALALSLPRLVYPLEWWPGHTVDAMFDDYARLAELAAMTLSDQYPLRHPANSEISLSFYYAAFYPMAVLKQLIPVLTLKDAIFLISTLYFALLGASLVEVSFRLTRDKYSGLLLLFLCTWFGGLDWVLGDFLPFYAHSEWWARAYFEKPSQWSGFLTASQWTIHHFLGFYLCLIAWVMLRHARFTRPWQKSLAVPLLLIAAIFHSPFGFLPMLVLGLYWLPLLVRRFAWRWSSPLLILLLLAPLAVFTNRMAASTLLWQPALLRGDEPTMIPSLLAYVSLLPLVDMAAIPLLLLWLFPRFERVEKWLFLGAVTYFFSSFFVHVPLFNNYSMRGLLLPGFVFFLLFARHWQSLPRPVLIGVLPVILVVGGMGGLREATSGSRYALWASSVARQALLDLPPHPPHYLELRRQARDDSSKILIPDGKDYRKRRPYLGEKLLPDVPPGKFKNMEREIAGRPPAGRKRHE